VITGLSGICHRHFGQGSDCLETQRVAYIGPKQDTQLAGHPGCRWVKVASTPFTNVKNSFPRVTYRRTADQAAILVEVGDGLKINRTDRREAVFCAGLECHALQLSRGGCRPGIGDVYVAQLPRHVRRLYVRRSHPDSGGYPDELFLRRVSDAALLGTS
jgi:hypothetical protein